MDAYRQCCGAGTKTGRGTAGIVTFCLSGAGTGMHFGPVPEPDLYPDPI
jgi:hypothetical protein